MRPETEALCKELVADIERAYQGGISTDEAERLAGKFLFGQVQIAEELASMDMDSRMKKSGLKAVKAAVYMDSATKGDKKPSDTFLQSLVDMSEIVKSSQDTFDIAEAERDRLQNYYNIFKDGHIFYRGISRGNFG